MPLKIQQNISLAKYTTFKIGGPAKYFCVVKNTDEIKEVLEFAESNKLKVFILGSGSNLLVSDNGFNGLVIRIMNNELRIMNNEVFVGSGFSLAKLVLESVKADLTGLEWSTGIPGTIGGAVCNNAGAHGKCIGDVVEEVETLEVAQKSSTVPKRKPWGQHIFTNKQCQFSYRNSIFKKEKRHVILNVVLKLKKGNQKESRKIISEYLKLRADKQPLKYNSAGSVFKNPRISEERLKKIFSEYPKLKIIAKDNTVPAGWFIETLKLKGKKIGRAIVSEKHGNFIVNTGNAKAEDVVILISLIKQKVRDNFGIQLNEEIEYVGFGTY